MERQPFLKSFKNAFCGIQDLFLTERNFRIDIFFALLAGFFCVLTRTRGVELAVIVLCIALVLGLEGLNSALEATVDLAIQELHPLAKTAKDMAAGAVLIAALLSVAIGAIIFVPKLLLLVDGTLRVTETLMPRLGIGLAALVVYLAWLVVHPLPQINTSKEDELR